MNEVSYEILQNSLTNKRVLVIGGFSGMGYSNPNYLKSILNSLISDEIAKFGRENVVVVSGATSDGIGMVYKIAKKLKVETFGIVSESAKEFGVDPDCDKVFFVKDPLKTWKVLDDNGSSYFVNCVNRNSNNNGCLFYFGGGDVAKSEIEEALKNKINVYIDTRFLPDKDKLNKALLKNPNMDPNPTKTFLGTIGFNSDIYANSNFSKNDLPEARNHKLKL